MPDAPPPTGPALFDLTGQRALVTGSTQGLGLALARGLAEAGASVVINGRTAAKIEPVVAELKAAGLDATPLVMDVTDDADVVASLGRLAEDGIHLDILVNNVGIQDRVPLAEMSSEAFRKVIDVNLTSAFVVTRQLAPGMIARGHGKVINVCSLMSDLGRPTTGNYAAAKGGLRMLTRAMAVEWAEHNLQVNAIGPGYFATELTRPLVEDEKFNRWICGRTPANRWGRPEELIGAAVYFASPASSFVNGQILYVDGGLTAAI
ncbi:MAG: SDR family oxidoreductase [Planctomycetota bacterium]